MRGRRFRVWLVGYVLDLSCFRVFGSVVWLGCVIWRDLDDGVGWAMGLRVIQDGISDLGTRFSGLAVCWSSEDFVSSGQPESLILAQNERWRHA